MINKLRQHVFILQLLIKIS